MLLASACQSTDDTLELYVLGRLGDSETACLEEHLLLCADCQRRVEDADDDVRAIRIALQELGRETVPPPRDAWSELPLDAA
jgi:anti-sigma factor RsiW